MVTKRRADPEDILGSQKAQVGHRSPIVEQLSQAKLSSEDLQAIATIVQQSIVPAQFASQNTLTPGQAKSTYAQSQVGELAPAMPATPLDSALSKLYEELLFLMNDLDSLKSYMQPLLRKDLFSDEGSVSEGRVETYSTYDEALSPTLVSVNSSLNRLEYIRSKVSLIRSNVVL